MPNLHPPHLYNIQGSWFRKFTNLETTHLSYDFLLNFTNLHNFTLLLYFTLWEFCPLNNCDTSSTNNQIKNLNIFKYLHRYITWNLKRHSCYETKSQPRQMVNCTIIAVTNSLR